MKHCGRLMPASLHFGSKLAEHALLGCCWQKAAAFLQPKSAQGIAAVMAAHTFEHHAHAVADSPRQHDCHKLSPGCDGMAL